MHIGVLPQVDRGQMKAAGLHLPDQPAERAAGGQQSRAVVGETARQCDQIRAQFLRRGIGIAHMVGQRGGACPVLAWYVAARRE